ncbi:sigma factor-like helix-turn-helix DNA-binding protein [Niallia sp. JL1B1071]|uniref:sigma-70 region 4 domain-containing protein n=1 Tax=Niallia tiangongensis TaxID=3237105 RepID=UPI0037DC7A76
MDSSILLTRLGLLDEQARLAFLLKYYYGFSYKKIAQYLPISERKAKQVIYSSLIIYTNNGKLVPIHHIEDVIKKEVSLLKSSLQLNQVTEKKTLHIETSKRSWRKSPVIILTLLVLFAGGSINQETLGKTRVSLGPDVYKIYKEGGVLQLGREIQQKGYTDIYTYPEIENNTLYVQFVTPESLENKEEVTVLIDSYLKERDLVYEIKYEEVNQVVDVELTEEQKAANKQMEMEQEIFEFVTSTPYYYMQSFGSDPSGDSTEIILSESIPEEEETKLKDGIKNIIKKYDLEWNFSIGKVGADVVQMENAIWGILPALGEAYMFGGKKYKVYDVYPTYEDNQLKFDIYTELAFTTEEDMAKNMETAKELKRSLQLFLKHEDIQSQFNYVSYVIKIYGDNRKEVEFDT